MNIFFYYLLHENYSSNECKTQKKRQCKKEEERMLTQQQKKKLKFKLEAKIGQMLLINKLLMNIMIKRDKVEFTSGLKWSSQCSKQ